MARDGANKRDKGGAGAENKYFDFATQKKPALN